MRQFTPLRSVTTTLLALGLLSGCGVSRAGFVAEADGACARSVHRLAALERPQATDKALGYALDVYTEEDRVLTLLSEMDLPGGDARALRTRWLGPARRDLGGYRPQLKELRQAVLSGDSDTVGKQLDMLARTGSHGVDGALLARYGLGHCEQLFGGLQQLTGTTTEQQKFTANNSQSPNVPG